MGDEARCTAHFGDAVSEGKAVLETDELVFRGEQRLVIPRSDIRSASAEDGRLIVEFAGGTAAFELGPHAERWADKIRNPKTLLDKLGIKRESQVSVVGVDDEHFRALLRDEGVEATDEPRADSDFVVYQAADVQDLERLFHLRKGLKATGAIWVVAPKGGREPREAQVLEAGKRAGLVDVKVARFSATHTAHKFVIPRADR